MKNINKNLPVIVLRALKDFISSLDTKHANLFHLDNSDTCLLKLTDNDQTSGFYFTIEKFDPTNGLYVSRKPENKSRTNGVQTWISPKDIATYFKIWNDCLIEYAELEEFYKDPYLKNLEDQFLTDFNLQEDTKADPLSLKQIYFLEESLTKIEDEIVNYKNEIDNEQIALIVQETKYIKSHLGKQTKEWVAKKVSGVLAKITIEGPGVLKSIFKEMGKELMSQGVKYLLEHGDKLIP